MKILIVSLFLPRKKATHAGGRYVYALLEHLSKNHEIYLATRLEKTELPALELLRPLCREIYPYTYRTVGKRSLPDIVRLLFNYAGFSRFAGRIAQEGSFDLIQVEWVETAVLMKKTARPMVLDAHDVITKPAERLMKNSRGMSRPFNFLRYLAVKTLEKRTLKKFAMVFTLSEYDRRYLLAIDPRIRARVVPVPAGLDITGSSFERQKDTILFLASYKYRRVNVEAALYFYREVFPLIRKRVPEAKFIIAGYGPPEELISLEGADPGVSVPGFVEDLEACYKKAPVFVAPILVGGGIIVKILDAMAAGTPVVTTTYGNEGIGALPGRDLLVADDPESFAAAVIKLLEYPHYAEEIARNGLDYVRQHFSPGATMSKIEAAYKELS